MSISYIEDVELTVSNAYTAAFGNSTEPLWDENDTYSIGSEVRYAHNDAGGTFISFRVYTSRVDGNVGHTPPDGQIEDDYWVISGVDNRYACLDPFVNTYSETASSDINLNLNSMPSGTDIIQLVNVQAEVWYAYYGSTNILFASGNLISGQNGEADRRRNLTIRVPVANQSSIYRVRLVRNTSATIQLGQLVIGTERVLEGELKFGLSLDGDDYTNNNLTKGGPVAVVEGPYLKRAIAQVEIPRNYFNQYHRSFVSRRAKNTVYIFTDEADYNETTSFGIGRCSLLVPGPTKSIADIAVEGTI